MSQTRPLKKILESSRHVWDVDGVRPVIRDNFKKMILCRTPALGAEVYTSETERICVNHTCKSKSCPSCGHRASQQWQREQWAALPDIPYCSIVFTMPDVLWPIFQRNRHFIHDLPILGAQVIQQWVKATYGARVLIMVVPHTFGRRLNFNAHLHILVSAAGLREADNHWIVPLTFDKGALMRRWRYALITLLREALKENLIASDSSARELKTLFTNQYERWWNIDIANFKSKAQFLRYAGRYIRHPPIAEHRIEEVSERAVFFWRKDLKLKKTVLTEYPIEKFVSALAEQVPDRYSNSMRYFGLLAPRSKNQTSNVIFALVGQKKRPQPEPLTWRKSLIKNFGRDPLIDKMGQMMHWTGRLSPMARSDGVTPPIENKE